MPIDSSIALGVRAPADPLNQLARVLQVQGLQKQAETADFEMGEKRRAIERQNKLYGLLAQTEPDQLEPTLTRGGFLKEAGDVGKQRRENVKLDAEAKAKEIEAAGKRLDLAGQAFGSVRANPTPETAMAALDFLEQNKVYTPQQTAQYRAQIAANPQSIAGLADQAFRAALSAKDQLPKYDTRNLGGTTETTAIDPVTGKLAVVNTAQNTQSPDSTASVAASIENNKRSVGAQYANAAATREIANATRDAAKIKDTRETEMKLADDYRAQGKAFKEVSDAYKQINATLDKSTTSPAATLAAATKFMKLLDPGSVVRESELGMALQASGVIDRAMNYHNVLLRGKVLTPQQAKDFKDITGQIYKAAQQQQQAIDSNYKQQAQQYGLRPEMIVQDLGQNAGTPSAPDVDALVKKYLGAR